MMVSGPFFQFDNTATIALQNFGIAEPMDPSIPSASSSPLDNNRNPNFLCRVCERPYDGSQHFGVDICRACAAFFRRCVNTTNRRPFVCRRGTNNCPLNTSSRKTTCQYCRYQKCLEIGLTADLVLGRRSPDSDSASGSEGKSIEDPEIVQKPPTPVQLVPIEIAPPQIQDSVPVLRPIPTIGSPNLEVPSAQLINKIVNNYKEFTKKRLEIELSMPRPHYQPTLFIQSGRPLYKATREMMTEMSKRQAELLHEFLGNTFDYYAQSDISEQKRICALSFPALWEMESCYWTYRNMPLECEGLMMCTQTTYIDVKDIRYWLGNTDGYKESDIQVAESCVQKLLDRSRTMVLDSMHKLILKESEFITLIALNIWAERNHQGDRKTEENVKRVLDEIRSEMHGFYTEGLNVKNYASRIIEASRLCTVVENADITSAVENIFFADLTAYIYNP